MRKLKAAYKNDYLKKNAQWQSQYKTMFYLPLLRFYVFHRFGQYFYAISRARVVIRSGSSIIPVITLKFYNFNVTRNHDRSKRKTGLFSSTLWCVMESLVIIVYEDSSHFLRGLIESGRYEYPFLLYLRTKREFHLQDSCKNTCKEGSEAIWSGVRGMLKKEQKKNGSNPRTVQVYLSVTQCGKKTVLVAYILRLRSLRSIIPIM